METGCAWVAFPGQRLPQHRLHGNRPFEQQTEEAGPEAVADPLETVPPDYDAIVQHFMQAVPDNPTLAEGAAYEFYEKGNEAEWKHSNGKQWNVRKEADKYIKTKKEQ